MVFKMHTLYTSCLLCFHSIKVNLGGQTIRDTTVLLPTVGFVAIHIYVYLCSPPVCQYS